MDWWDTFLMLPHDKKSGQQIVFLDGHAEGHYDAVWERLFGPIQRVMSVSNKVCFENAALVPPSYSSVLRTSFARSCATLTNAFVDFVLRQMGCEDVKKVTGKVVLLDYKPFRSHPRLDLASAKHLFSNMDVVAELIQSLVEGATVEVVRLDRDDFETQLRVVRSAHVLIGHTETGLAHLIFLSPDTHVIELEIDTHSSDMQQLSSWKPNITHRVVHIDFTEETIVRNDTVKEAIIPLIQKFAFGKTVSPSESDTKSSNTAGLTKQSKGEGKTTRDDDTTDQTESFESGKDEDGQELEESSEARDAGLEDGEAQDKPAEAKETGSKAGWFT
uniref:Glycosyltransferase 61 catalytic domain-containing protein n=1 Tax=Cyclophora tenuis TaxID=216820 RepID=A0A6U1QCY4_CYCTE